MGYFRRLSYLVLRIFSILLFVISILRKKVKISSSFSVQTVYEQDFIRTFFQLKLFTNKVSLEFFPVQTVFEQCFIRTFFQFKLSRSSSTRRWCTTSLSWRPSPEWLTTGKAPKKFSGSTSSISFRFVKLKFNCFK